LADRGNCVHGDVAAPEWQAWLRQHQPPLLVAWGRYDPSFLTAEAEAYRRDVPDAEVHVLDAGHFALDEQPDQVAALTRGFLRASAPVTQEP
jgi:pimeloyl-ACP methyl ester carboxylesterase